MKYRIVSLGNIIRWTSLLMVVAIVQAAPSNPEKLLLWNNQAPVGGGQFEAANTPVTVHLPAPDKANGAAMVICPGGGYAGLVVDAEGHNIAKWLNEHGIAGIVLEYRFPKGRPFVPLIDVQRTIRTVRANAKQWNIDPSRVGIIGVSAGGHLASAAGTHFDGGFSKATDPVERFSCRPDFVLLVYPVITMGEKTSKGTKDNLLGRDPKPELLELFSNEKQVTSKTPPMFITHSVRDKDVPVENSRMMAEALKTHNVPVEYMELTKGGHTLNALWGQLWDSIRARMLAWLAEQKMIPRAQAS